MDPGFVSVPDGRMTAPGRGAGQLLDRAENPTDDPAEDRPTIELHTTTPLKPSSPIGTAPLLPRADRPLPTPAPRSVRRSTWRRSLVLSALVHLLVLGVGAVLLALEPEPEPELLCVTQCTFVEPDVSEEPGEELESIDMLEPIEIEETPLPVPESFETPPQEPELPPLEPVTPLEPRTPALQVTPRMFERPKEVAPAPVEPPPTATPVPVTPQPVARPPRPKRGVKLMALHIPSAARYYPDAARRRGIEGTVIVRVTVDAGGRVILVEVDRSSGYAILDQAAVRLMYDARFRAPGAAVTKKAPINFILR